MLTRDTNVLPFDAAERAPATVLVLDRDAAAREATASLLREAGHDVIGVDTVEKATWMIAREQVTVALVAVEVKAGAEPHADLCALIEAQANSDTLFIAMLPEANGLLSALVLAAGANDSVDKHAEPLEILARVRNQLRTLRRREQLSSLVHTDELTGLLNRRGLVGEIDRSLARSRRTEQPVSLLFLDLDGFKEINDTLGHAAGDLLLKKVARVLARAARAGDTVGRLGGDEFVMLLPGADAEGAAHVAGRVERLLAELAIPGAPLKVGASIGIVTKLPQDGTTRDALLAEADRLMYSKKRQRRNARRRGTSVTQEIPRVSELQAVAGAEPR